MRNKCYDVPFERFPLWVCMSIRLFSLNALKTEFPLNALPKQLSKISNIAPLVASDTSLSSDILYLLLVISVSSLMLIYQYLIISPLFVNLLYLINVHDLIGEFEAVSITIILLLTHSCYLSCSF
jgi:hypothetical protein